ncbi:hypothetical protein BT69DRAFT_97592 [Atractiella rhizophila]|nr:hypothetical protein BT69DRAFT_97592 [Atractiella rhizophila]
MFIPPASTRSFTVEPLYETKEEAKDAAARIVIKYGVPEQAAEAAKNEQERRHKANQGLPAQAAREKEKKLEAQHVLAEKPSLVVQRDMAESGGDQPISLLYQTMAQNMGNGHNPNFEFGIDATSGFYLCKIVDRSEFYFLYRSISHCHLDRQSSTHVNENIRHAATLQNTKISEGGYLPSRHQGRYNQDHSGGAFFSC